MKLNLKKKIKLNFNISKREKIMLIILGIAIIFTVYYKLVYSKQIIKVNQLKAQKEEYNSKLKGLQANIVLNKKLNQDLIATNAKVQEVSKDFFPSIIEEKIIVIIDGMLNENNVISDSITISEVSIETVAKEKTEENTKTSLIEEMVKKYIELMKGSTSTAAKDIENKTENTSKDTTKEQTSLEAKKITLKLNFEGTHDDVMSFIDEIKGFYKRIIIKNINITAKGEGIRGSMILDFYAIPKLEEEDIDYNKWQYDGNYGKDNMFKDNRKETVNEANIQGIEIPDIGN